jgi:hypothetical protein
MKLLFSLFFSCIQVSLLAQPAAETVAEAACPVYKIPLEAIQVIDPETYLNSEIINFTIPGLSTSVTATELRMLIDHHFPPHSLIHPDTLTRDELLAAAIYKSLGKDRLSINGRLFTGTIRLYSNSYWYDLGRRSYPALSLMINSYIDGVLQRSQSLYDAGSLCNDSVRDRPS